MQTQQRKDRNTKNKSQKITDVHNAEHQIGQDNISAQQNQQNVENVKEATAERSADQWDEYNTLTKQHLRQKKIIGIMIEFRE